MRITAASPEQHNPERLAIFVDGQFVVGCHALVFAQFGLRVDDEITPETLAALRDADSTQVLVDRAVRLLATRPRSRQELALALRRGTKAHPAPDPALIQQALSQLTDQGLIDDQAFAEYWVEQRDRFRPKGAQALRAELRGRGIGREEIEATIAPDRDAERAIEAGRRLAERLGASAAQDARAFRERLGAFLQRRGFSYATARAAIAELWRTYGGRGDVLDEAPSD